MQKFFRSRLSIVDEPTRSLRSQNVGKKIFIQESTRRTRRVDSWPETEIVTELCQELNLLRSRLLVIVRVDSRPETRFFIEGFQKDFFFRSQLSEVTSRLGIGLTASTAIFWISQLGQTVSNGYFLFSNGPQWSY